MKKNEALTSLLELLKKVEENIEKYENIISKKALNDLKQSRDELSNAIFEIKNAWHLYNIIYSIGKIQEGVRFLTLALNRR